MVTQIFIIVRVLMATHVFFIVRVVVLRVVVVVFFSYCNF